MHLNTAGLISGRLRASRRREVVVLVLQVYYSYQSDGWHVPCEDEEWHGLGVQLPVTSRQLRVTVFMENKRPWACRCSVHFSSVYIIQQVRTEPKNLHGTSVPNNKAFHKKPFPASPAVAALD
jgi:hypothetical protein